MADEPKLTENDEEEFVILEEPPKDAPKGETVEEGAEPPKAPVAEEDDEDEDDVRLGTSEEDSEAEITASRKRRQERRTRQKIARENAERELRFLRDQNAVMLQRLSAVEGHALTMNEQTLDQRAQAARTEVRQAEMIIARAIEAGNGEDVATAMRLRDEALQRAQQLEAAKGQVAQVREQHVQQSAATAGPDPRVASLAQQWMEANDWYDPKGGDEDSQVVNTVDAQLVREGFNPAEMNYWQELTKRVGQKLAPELQSSTQSKPSTKEEKEDRKAPPVGSQREHAPKSTRNEIYVTPERKQAMIDAGIWDDPARRNRMLKAYQSYDRAER